MATVHQARSSVVSLLYAYGFGKDGIEELKENTWSERKIRNRQKEFAITLFDGTIQNLDFIDATITEHLTEKNLDEIGRVEKSILRVGVFEIKFQRTEKAIVINEALELVKEFGVEPAKGLINGVLDSI